MKTFFTVAAFCLIVSAFGIMIIGAWLEKGQLWVDLDIKFSEIKFKK